MTTQGVSFFKTNSFRNHGGSGKGYNPLPNGEYNGKLIEVRPASRKSFQDGQDEPTLIFIFELDNGRSIARTVKASNHPASKCIELVSSMGPMSLDIIQFTDRLQNHIISLIDKPFILKIQTSRCGKYNDLCSIYPLTRRGA